MKMFLSKLQNKKRIIKNTDKNKIRLENSVKILKDSGKS